MAEVMSHRSRLVISGGIGVVAGLAAWAGVRIAGAAVLSLFQYPSEAVDVFGDPITSPLSWALAGAVTCLVLAVMLKGASKRRTLACGLLTPVIGEALVFFFLMLLDGALSPFSYILVVVAYAIPGLLLTGLVAFPAGVGISFLIRNLVSAPYAEAPPNGRSQASH